MNGDWFGSIEPSSLRLFGAFAVIRQFPDLTVDHYRRVGWAGGRIACAATEMQARQRPKQNKTPTNARTCDGKWLAA